MSNEIPARNEGGGLGYPLAQTILSGMELLGIILSGGEKDDKAFHTFWEEFIKDNPSYNKTNLEKIFRVSIRHGTAHYFLTKFGIQISKNGENDLTKTRDGNLNIDVKVLNNYFQKTYQRIKNKINNETDGNLLKNYNKGYEKLLDDLKGVRHLIDNFNLPIYQESTSTSWNYSTKENNSFPPQSQTATATVLPPLPHDKNKDI